MTFALSYPARLRLDLLIAGASALFLLQVASGTSQFFAELIFLFIVLSGVTVNALGGLNTLTGLCVAALSLKVVVISQITKVFLWEPADARLDVPIETAGVLVVGMVALCFAALLTSLIRFRKPLLVTEINRDSLRDLSIILTAIGFVVTLGTILLGGGEEGGLRVGGIVGILRQFGFCLGFSIGVGTVYTIVASNGGRCFSLFNGIPFCVSFLYGVLYASKQGMLEPFLYVALAAAAFRYAIRPMHILLAISFLVFAAMILFPFGQSARNAVRGYGLADTIKESGLFMKEHFGSVEGFQQMLAADVDAPPEQDFFNYYEKPLGMLERMSLIKMVDLLTAASIEQGDSGWDNVTHGFKMMVPRFLYPAKPVWNTGQVLAHKVGMLADDDESTQVSFGFIADAFSAFGWWGAAIIPFVIGVGFFTVYKFLVGSLDRNVWGIYFAAELQHAFTESTIASMTLMILYNPATYIALYFGMKWLARSGLARSILHGPLRRLAIGGGRDGDGIAAPALANTAAAGAPV